MYNSALQGVDYSGCYDPSQNNLIRLKDLSSKDESWDIGKTKNLVVSDYIKNTGLESRYKRMVTCANVLEMALKSQLDGTQDLKLRRTFFCGYRECPMCSVSRSRVWRRRLFGAIPPMIEANPKLRFLHLTISVRTCAITDLRATLETMNYAFQKLMKRRNIAKLTHGYLRRFEVTKAKDELAHPHFHVLLAVQPSYFGADYINQAEWSQLWKECLQVDYMPRAYIQAVKVPVKSEDPYSNIINEVTKVACYATKDKDLLDDRDWFLEHTNQVARTKEIVLSGIFRDYITEKPIEEKDILNASNDEEEEVIEREEAIAYFNYYKQFKGYATKV